MKTQSQLKFELLELNELGELLGCKDTRTLVGWCLRKQIPVIRMGKCKYVAKAMVDQFVENELRKFYSGHDNADQIIQAIERDNKDELAELLNAPATKQVKKQFRGKVNSNAAQAFKEKFKAA